MRIRIIGRNFSTNYKRRKHHIKRNVGIFRKFKRDFIRYRRRNFDNFRRKKFFMRRKKTVKLTNEMLDKDLNDYFETKKEKKETETDNEMKEEKNNKSD